VVEAWGHLERLRGLVERGEMDAVGAWMSIARGMLEDFKSQRGLFPYERGKRITWFDEGGEVVDGRGRKRLFGGDLDLRLEEMQSRLIRGAPGIFRYRIKLM